MYKTNIKKLKNPNKILEIGFGNGKQLEIINNKYPNINLYGIDISEEMYTTARKRLNNKIKLTIENADEIHYPDNFFDNIISTDTSYFCLI